jgi:hypothetical protein
MYARRPSKKWSRAKHNKAKLTLNLQCLPPIGWAGRCKFPI